MKKPNTQDIFNIRSEADFVKVALEVFRYQFKCNDTYRSFCDLLYIHPSEVRTIRDIPFLPIQFFKTREVISGTDTPAISFTSSGTTGSITSKHHVIDLEVYEQSFVTQFERTYGPITEYTILALLPSYLEREGSSLIYMAQHLIERSKDAHSGFYLKDLDTLSRKLTQLDASGKKVLLLGVSFALLDLVEKSTFNLKNTTVMETGGMKGRRKEMIRVELHHVLQSGFGIPTIHSEYEMTELLSQAYAAGERFISPPWMRVIAREPEDALTLLDHDRTGGLNVIDLANIDSCAFIATQDLGKTYADGTFTVAGRFDASDIRGCNLMAL